MSGLLKQILQFDNLSGAWDEVVKNGDSPGVDGVTIEAFAHHWEANLRNIQQTVRANHYQPDPLERFTIPKKDGSPRLLGNLTLRDKVLQRAVLRVLDDRYEQVFLNCSFGYRPKRSVKNAVELVLSARQSGRCTVLDADLDDFFHSIDHHLLLRFLREQLDDDQVIALIESWLKIGRPDKQKAVGTPLGAIISPLLSNIFLHYLDLVMTGGMDGWQNHPSFPADESAAQRNWVYVRFADDFMVLCRSQEQAELALRWVQETVKTLKLTLEPTKTTLTTFEQGFEYLGCYFKGQDFYFNYKGSWVKVDTGSDWTLFYKHGPVGYE